MVRYIIILILLLTFSFSSNNTVLPLHNQQLSKNLKIKISTKEKRFVSSHKIKVISTTSWEPFNMLVDGKLTGIGYDFWKLIKNRVGLNCSIEINNDWSEVLKKVKSREADLVFATSNYVGDSKKVIFSKPYDEFDIAIVTRNDVGFILDLKLIKNRKIAVGKDYSVEKILKKHCKGINFIEVKDVKEALEYVQDGKAYAMIDIFPVVSYMINRYKFSNLKISGEINVPFKVRFMIRSDYKELVKVINKAIDSITPQEKKDIYSKYISVNYQIGYTKEYIFRLVIIGLIILLVAFGWIIYLKREISKREELEDRLEKLATIDRLTGIFNRYKMDVSLDEQIKIVKRYHRKFSLIFFDIDYFKKINDSYGHRVGDIVLRELTNVVSKLIRESDIFGRWGGEEFLIILPETSLTEAVKTSEKLRMEIEKHSFKIVKNLTCSFGVTEANDDDTPETIVKRADEMMYLAKQNGRNRVEFM